MDPVPLPVSSHGSSSAVWSYLSGRFSLLRLFSWTQFRCPSLLTDPFSLLCLFLRTQLRCPVLYFRPISVAPSLFTDPVQCPVHLPVLFHPVPSEPVQFSAAIRTCLPLISGRSVVSTRMCARYSCDLAVSIPLREDILLRYNKVAVISNAMEELCCVSISIL